MLIISSIVAFLLITYRPSFASYHKAQHRSLLDRSSRSHVPYHPFAASQLQHHEVRGGASHGISDYVMHGLSNIMHMVSNEYDLRSSESFYWGRDGNPYANLTAYVGDKDVRVLSMERFGDVLHSAECSTDSIKFTFSKEVQFDTVQKAWQWVNDADANYIALVTENARCNIPDGDRTVRQPWHVTQATFDDGANTVTLSAEPKTWKEAFGDWRLKMSSKGLWPEGSPERRMLQRRYEIVGSPQIPLSMDFSGLSIPLLSEDESTGASASISCDPCYTTGSLDFDIDVIPYVLPTPHLSGYFQVIADGVGATFTAKASATAALFEGAKGSQELWGMAMPDLGIYIKDIIEIGPILKVEVEGGLGEVEAECEVTTGVTVSIPDDAIYRINFDDDAQNEISDWTQQLTYTPPEMSSSISLTAYAQTELRLEFDGEVLGIGVAVGAQIAAPKVDLEAKAFWEQDACDVPGAQYGLEIDIELGAELDVFEVANLGAIEAGATQTIAAFSYPVLSTCLTLASAPASAPAPTVSGSGSASASYIASATSSVAAYSSAAAYSSVAAYSTISGWSSQVAYSSAATYSSAVHEVSAAVYGSYPAPVSSYIPVSTQAPASSYIAASSYVASSYWVYSTVVVSVSVAA